jgi:hypothetical protein
MSAPSADDLDRWADGMVSGEGKGLFVLVVLLESADDGDTDSARALVGLAGRRLRAGRPVPPILADWIGRRLEDAARRPDGSVVRVLGRGAKPQDWERRHRVYWRITESRQSGLTLVAALERASRELGLSFDRCEAVYKRLRASPMKPVRIDIK